jgi:hypothetical protein
MRIVFAIIAFVLMTPASQAATPLPCGSSKELVKQLDQRYREKLVSYGLSANKRDLLQVFVSEKGTFTIVASSPNGISCIIGAGDSFEIGKMPKEMTAL